MCAVPFGAPGYGVWTAGPRCGGRTGHGGRRCVGPEPPTRDRPQPAWAAHLLLISRPAARRWPSVWRRLLSQAAVGQSTLRCFAGRPCPLSCWLLRGLSPMFTGGAWRACGGRSPKPWGPHARHPGLHSSCSPALQLFLLRQPDR